MAAFKTSTAPLCRSALGLSFLMTAPAAFADVTADQIWADWQNYMASSGYEITGEETRSGGTLTVSDLTMTAPVSEEDGTVTITLGQVAFEETGDGTVAVILPQTLPITIDVEGSDAEEVTISLDYLSTALEVLASGDPQNILYAYSADEIAMELREVVVEGEAVDIGTARVAMADVEGSNRIETGNLRRSQQTMSTGAISYLLDMADPEDGEGRVFVNGVADKLELEAGLAMPSDMDGTDMAAAIRNGFDADARITYTNGATEYSVEEDGQTVEGKSSSESGAFMFALGEAGLTYALGANAMQMIFSGDEVPFPIELGMQAFDFSLTMPVMATEESQDFALGLRMADFTMSDMIWSILDPQGQLPHDPATLDIDTTGTVTLDVDLLDPEEMEGMDSGETVPGELNALDLNTLVLRAAGAELTGQGSFTFDNSDLQTFGGFPAPDGAVDLRLQGVNGLMDALIAMGLLTQDQAMGARMMMGMFAVPGEGEDVLTSTIEVKPDGQVLANGQRLR